MTDKITGRLLYTGWLNRPWRLVPPKGDDIDLFPLVDTALTKWNGQAANHDQTRDSYALFLDGESEFDIKYTTDGNAGLWKRNGFGFSNIIAYFDCALVWLSGRMVVIEIDDDRIHLAADPAEEVFGLHFTHSNSCAVPDGAERTVCKISTDDTCIFLCCGADGFSCEKFSGSTARLLLDRHHKGEMNASRIGSCALLGREDIDG